MSAAGLNFATVAPGTRLALADGKVAVVIDNPRDGTWLVCRDPAQDDDDEYLVSVSDVIGLA